MSNIHFLHDDILRLLPQSGAFRPEVRQRLEWLLFFSECQSVSATCRKFGISRSTFYRWAERFNPTDLHTLEDNPTNILAARAALQEKRSPLFAPLPVAAAESSKWSAWRANPAQLFSLLTQAALVLMLMYMLTMELKLRSLQASLVSPADAFSTEIQSPTQEHK